MDPILEIARRRALAVIEDAAQAHGSAYKGRLAGGLGDFGCFSFYPTKNLGACGEGGIVVTSDPERARRVRSLRDWGQTSKYRHELLGFNYRMDGIQGAILRIKLRRLERWTEMRRAHAARYEEELADSGVGTPVEMPWARHVYHAYTVRSPRRDALHDALARPRDRVGHPLPGARAPPADLRRSRTAAPEPSPTRRPRRTRCCACRSSRSFPRMLPGASPRASAKRSAKPESHTLSDPRKRPHGSAAELR